MKNKINQILSKLSYHIELLTILFIVFAIGITYGIIEAKWIDTSILDLQILGRWSYYHVGLLLLMFFTCLGLCLSHIQWMLRDRKKYIIFMSVGALPLSLMVEDATWFITRWQPILYNDWTMMHPGLGINLGITWIPLWYIITILFSISMFWIANIFAKKGYEEYKKKNELV